MMAAMVCAVVPLLGTSAAATGAVAASPAHHTHGAGIAAPARPKMLPAGRVAAADVGAPAGSQPLAPALPLAPATVLASAGAGPVLPFGGAPSFTWPHGLELHQPIVGMAATPTGKGYWLVASDGGVFSFGDAHFYGSTGNLRLNRPIVGMAATPTGKGYWLVASDGGVFSFGDAHFKGSTGGIHLWAPIIGMARTSTGGGYWLVASDGGIFSFGDAHFKGSTGGIHLWAPITGIAATPTGGGYWLVASDGGIFSFGDAHFKGSTGGIHLWAPITGMARTSTGGGYWLVASDGGIFTFGDAHYYGSAGGRHLGVPIVGMAATPAGNGYWLVEQSPPDLFSPALVAALNARAGVISASVLDLHTGISYQYRPGQLGITASIVKVEILGTLLAHAQAAHRALTPGEQSLATRMIEVSDNDAATALWNEVGGTPAVHEFDELVGMTATTPNSAWGLTTTTAADQVVLLQHLVESNSVLSDASRSYELGLMEHVTPGQAWGVSAGTAPGTIVALKNGWLPISSGWTVNSIGWIYGSGRDYLIAVTTSGDPSMGYGIDSISGVAAAAWAALAH